MTERIPIIYKGQLFNVIVLGETAIMGEKPKNVVPFGSPLLLICKPNESFYSHGYFTDFSLN